MAGGLEQDAAERGFAEHQGGTGLWIGWTRERSYETLDRNAAFDRDTAFYRHASVNGFGLATFSKHKAVNRWRWSFDDYIDWFIRALVVWREQWEQRV
jgi:hypothetical protein